MTRLNADRFQDSDKYTAYLRTTEGRLRIDLGWANLRSFLPADATGCRALDAGGGTGIFAFRLAEAGFEVALLDNSEPMLAVARKESDGRELKGRISFHPGDAARLSDFFPPSSFDTVLCHNLLEYVENPLVVLCGLAQTLKKNGNSVISLLVRNRWGEVLKAAIKEQDVELAKTALSAETVLDSLYGQPVRVFEPAHLRKMAEQGGLEPLALRGVRVVSDYLDCAALTNSAYQRLLDFELLLGEQPQFAAIARYLQIIARPCPGRPAGG